VKKPIQTLQWDAVARHYRSSGAPNDAELEDAFEHFDRRRWEESPGPFLQSRRQTGQANPRAEGTATLAEERGGTGALELGAGWDREEAGARDSGANIFCIAVAMGSLGAGAGAGARAGTGSCDEEVAERPAAAAAAGRTSGFAAGTGEGFAEEGAFWAGGTAGVAPTEGCVTEITVAGFVGAAARVADVAPTEGCEAAGRLSG